MRNFEQKDTTWRKHAIASRQRLHRSQQFEEIGIGLLDARRTVTRLDSAICAEAMVDRGATCFFSLPSVDTK